MFSLDPDKEIETTRLITNAREHKKKYTRYLWHLELIELILKSAPITNNYYSTEKSVRIRLNARRISGVKKEVLMNILGTLLEDHVIGYAGQTSKVVTSSKSITGVIDGSNFYVLDKAALLEYKKKYEEICRSALLDGEGRFGKAYDVVLNIDCQRDSFFRRSALIINSKYTLRTFNYTGENEAFFNFVLNNPGIKWSKTEIGEKTGLKMKRDFNNILSDKGFKGELRRAFFPVVTKNSIRFRRYLTKNDVVNEKFNIREMLKHFAMRSKEKKL